MVQRNYIYMVIATLFLWACASPQIQKTVEEQTELSLQKSSFSQLPNWGNEDFVDLAQAYNRSCERILRKDSQQLFGVSEKFGKAQEWQIACRKFAKVNPTKRDEIKQFFEENFMPYAVAAGTEGEGLFTGYYEAALKGSRTREGSYQYPLRSRPDDLVMVQLGDFREELKGQRIAGRVKNGNLKPYETHAEINAGKLPPEQDKILVWVDSPIDAFFVQIQGSGVVALNDGGLMRIGYAGQNGHPYYAVGRELVKNGELTKENVSMQSIRNWMQNNPDKARYLMETNKSYVFFEEVKSEGPKGGEGIGLTPMRSLAIDHSIIPYGLPVWLSADHPIPSQGELNRLMITQDTGGAIRGPVRGDFFWGYGTQAEKLAGDMKSQGRYWFLLPKNL
jgi:membrane-bound lytic murein transglycosylase A